jgi:hypothetical protein
MSGAEHLPAPQLDVALLGKLDETLFTLVCENPSFPRLKVASIVLSQEYLAPSQGSAMSAAATSIRSSKCVLGTCAQELDKLSSPWYARASQLSS